MDLVAPFTFPQPFTLRRLGFPSQEVEFWPRSQFHLTPQECPGYQNFLDTVTTQLGQLV